MSPWSLTQMDQGETLFTNSHTVSASLISEFNFTLVSTEIKGVNDLCLLCQYTNLVTFQLQEITLLSCKVTKYQESRAVNSKSKCFKTTNSLQAGVAGPVYHSVCSQYCPRGVHAGIVPVCVALNPSGALLWGWGLPQTLAITSSLSQQPITVGYILRCDWFL